MISVIIPTFNEEWYIENAIGSVLSQQDGVAKEIIVGDGGSSDATVSLARKYAQVVCCEKGRGAQLNAAAQKANGEILFFLYAHITLPPGALALIEHKINEEGCDGGGFSNVFSSSNDRIKRLGRLLNLRIWNNDHAGNTIFFGDNGLFVRHTTFDSLHGFKTIPIMEDYDFSKRLRKQFRTVRICEPKLIVSPRRHVKVGFIKTRLQWILIKRLYQLGVSPFALARWYRDVR